jgi:hypothetical protein
LRERVVDVAVADEGDGVAVRRPAHLVGDLRDSRDLGAAGAEQRGDLVLPDLLAEEHPFEHLSDRAVPPADPCGGHEGDRIDRRA